MDRRAFLGSLLFVPTPSRQSAQMTASLAQVPLGIGMGQVELQAVVENQHATELRVLVNRTQVTSVALTDPTAVKAKPAKKKATKE